jgi:hypothetical protein
MQRQRSFRAQRTINSRFKQLQVTSSNFELLQHPIEMARALMAALEHRVARTMQQIKNIARMLPSPY